MKRIDVSDPIYRSALSVFIGAKEIARPIFEEHDVDIGDDMAGRFAHTEDGYWLIWLPPKRSMPYAVWLGFLVHEVTHYVFELFEDRGIPTNVATDEPFAYFIQYIITCILQKV